MTKEELVTWIKTAKYVDGSPEYNEREKEWSYSIYEFEGEIYRVDYCNGHFSEEWGDKGCIRGSYKPYRVEKKVEIIEQVDYVPVVIPIEVPKVEGES